MNVVVAAEIRLTYILCTLFNSPVLSSGQFKSPLSALAMTPLVLLSLAASALCLATPLESVHASRVSEPRLLSNATTCPTCLLAKSSATTQSVFPWLFNNNNARFMYVRTDDRGWPVYQYFYNGKPMWLHFYDEGLFYDGFYIINDLEVSGYIMRVFMF